MDERFTILEAMFNNTATVIAAVADEHHALPTPCSEFVVDELLDHIALWIQVFDAAVNERSVGFDPATHVVDGQPLEIFGQAAQSIVSGLRELGSEREMTMTTSPVPGDFIVNMLLMEYIAHGWDLARSIGSDMPYADLEASAALRAAQAIVEPQYRGSGMFDQQAQIGSEPTPIDELVAFLGRDPNWERTA